MRVAVVLEVMSRVVVLYIGNPYYPPSPSGTLGTPGVVNYFLTNVQSLLTTPLPAPGTLQLEGATDTQEEKLLM